MALGVVKEGEGDEGERTHLQFVDISRGTTLVGGWWPLVLSRGAVVKEGEECCGEKQKCRGSIMFSMRCQCHHLLSYQEVTPLCT